MLEMLALALLGLFLLVISLPIIAEGGRLVYGEYQYWLDERAYQKKISDPNYVSPVRILTRNEIWAEIELYCREQENASADEVIAKMRSGEIDECKHTFFHVNMYLEMLGTPVPIPSDEPDYVPWMHNIKSNGATNG